MRKTSTIVGAIVTALLLSGVAGCGGGGAGATLSARPVPMELTRPEPTTIHLPADKPFSITLAPSTRSPELTGEASAHSRADKSGKAEAVAEVARGGKASATFQLGHALANETERMLDLEMSVTVHYVCDISADDDDLPLAAIHLNLYTRDDRSRTPLQLALVDHSSEHGLAGIEDTRKINFKTTLGAGRTGYIFVAGEVRIEAEGGRSASGSIKLDGLEMEIKTRPAPSVKATDNG